MQKYMDHHIKVFNVNTHILNIFDNKPIKSTTKMYKYERLHLKTFNVSEPTLVNLLQPVYGDSRG